MEEILAVAFFSVVGKVFEVIVSDDLGVDGGLVVRGGGRGGGGEMLGGVAGVRESIGVESAGGWRFRRRRRILCHFFSEILFFFFWGGTDFLL